MGGDRGGALASVRQSLSRLAWIEPFLILALAPFLTFPQRDVAPWLLLLVPILWGFRWLIHGRLTVPTPLDRPLLGLLIMVLVSLWATYDLLTGFHELCGILLGFAFYYALINGLRSRRAISTAVGLLIASGVAVALVSLVGTEWKPDKVPLLISFFRSIYRQLPPLVRDLPHAEDGFHANQVAGTLSFFLPLVVMLFLRQLRREGSGSLNGSCTKWRRVLNGLGLGVILILMLFVLLISQSRLSYGAAAVGLLLVIAAQGRGGRVVLGLVFIVAIILLAYLGPEVVGQAIFGIRDLELTSESTWNARVELWHRARRVIQDHPFTGIGLGTLTHVVYARYPTFLVSPGWDFVHAHSLYLQVAITLGIPGLVFFLWLLVAFGWMMWQVVRDAPFTRDRGLAMGLVFGMVSHLLFGIADAVHLGAKSGIFLWAFLGLGAALWANVEKGGDDADADDLNHRSVQRD